MTREEFFAELKKREATLLPPASDRAIELAKNALQNMRCANIPPVMSDIYKNMSGGIISGDSHIFPIEEIDRISRKYKIPSIVQVNRDLSVMPGMMGRTIFGRNCMFLFAFDTFGNFYMLNILNMNILREYHFDGYRAILDCLAVGKI
ncbi:MAG: hypothetical protein FWC83_02770 [Alphaproteobacteria bacterium]|nr:hypothetical protein [Alphaproteobacteria bacterium]